MSLPLSPLNTMISAKNKVLSYITVLNGTTNRTSHHMHKQQWLLAVYNLAYTYYCQYVSHKTSTQQQQVCSPWRVNAQHNDATILHRKQKKWWSSRADNSTAMFHFLRLILEPLCYSYLSSSFLLLPISSSSPSFSHFSLLHSSSFPPMLPFALDLLCPPALLFMVGHQCSHPLKLSSPLSSLHQDELVCQSHAVSILPLLWVYYAKCHSVS